jgi:hypothetical protein
MGATMRTVVTGNLYFSHHLLRLILKVMMKSDRDFVEIMLLCHTTGMDE